MITLRSALFNLWFFTVTFFITLLAALTRMIAPRHVLSVAMVWARIMVVAVRIICGIRLEVSGLQHIPPGAALIASRHQSAFDTLVWLTLLPRCCYVVKRELLRIPLFGPLMISAGMIAVDRSAGGSAVRALLRQGENAVREQRQIVIFPEGTRAAPGNIGELQPGIAALAARTGLPVIPVATDSGRCWGRRAFRKRPGVIRIMVGPPISAASGRVELMRSLRSSMGRLDHSTKPTDSV
ncbi:lysophospholipid acyltransferase family protein [Rhodopila sp.]|uniref:lysophospholipid acyltransferase family protein n=1 Tax=Rhodopila sp. TaxID=2480087 RepID=UPI003D0B1C0A